jgi:Dolichyl-phosphate-mannose-protein mannosyltransferase
MTFIYCFFFVLFLWFTNRIAIEVAARSLVEQLLVTFIIFTSSVIVTGFCLSGLSLTGNTPVWAFAVFIPATIIGFVLTKLNIRKTAVKVHHLSLLTNWYKGLSVYLKFLFGLMFLTVGIIGITNLALVLLTPPNEWDSMTGHLNRVMQYIQRGSMAHFGGTNWNIDTYPKSVCTIQIYSFLMTGRTEIAFKFIHHLSFWVTIIAVFGIAQRIAKNLTASVFCALAFAMFLDFLMQAISTETDNVLTAYLACLLYFLFSFHNNRLPKYLYLAALCFAVGYGHKITLTLLLPSIFVVMLYTVFVSYKSKTSSLFKIHFKDIFKLGLAIVICCCIWTLPTGYLKNIEVFGHPIGPPTALKHQSIERATSQGGIKNLVKQGTRNVIRYGYDFANLDGIRNTDIGVKINDRMRRPLVWLENKLQLRLDEETNYTIFPFAFSRRFLFYNANPYWGVFGFALVFPLVFLVLTTLLRSRVHVVLALALGLHWLALAYSAPYDPFKGRYFQETGLFGVLFFTLLFTSKINISQSKHWLLKTYVGFVTVLACVSAVLAVYLNMRALPLPAFGEASAFDTPRMNFMTFGRPDITPAYQKFDNIVPQNATVALATINDDYEYPLYGKNLSRRLIQINPFERGLQPIPKEADYLFYSRQLFGDSVSVLPTDIRLGTDSTLKNLIVPGQDYYLRKLK